MLTYKQAKELFARAKDKTKGKRLKGREGSTWLVQDGNDFAIRFHATRIVTICKDGTYILRNGNYYTPSTKERICGYSPARVWSENNTWYLGYWNAKVLFKFASGMRVDSMGNPTTAKERKELAVDIVVERREYQRAKRAERKERAALLAAEAERRHRLEFPERYTGLGGAVYSKNERYA